MPELADYELLCVSTALSPLTHNSGSEGNETLVNQETIITPDGPARVPVLSGNALRHRLVREPGARWLCERYGLAGKLGVDQLNFLFSGGSLTKGGATENIGRTKKLWRLFPLLRVLGGSLPDQIVNGSLCAWRGVLVCAENAARLRSILPAGWLPEGDFPPAHRLIGGYQYTRVEATKAQADLVGDAPGESAQMIYSGQCLMPGAVFVHGFALRRATPVDLGALLHSLALWSAGNATVGGMSAKGHGRLETLLQVSPETDLEAARRAYLDHADAVREEAVAFLNELFAPETLTGGGRKKKAAA